MSETTLQVAGYLNHSTVNGDGLRFTLFLSGCLHNCVGCHNQEAQHPSYGQALSLSHILTLVDKNLPLIDGITLSGGDPFYQASKVLQLLQHLAPFNLSTWVYTGYTYEQLLSHPLYVELLPYIDVLVDGPFIASLQTDTLKYIGSSNQRIIQLCEGTFKSFLTFST